MIIIENNYSTQGFKKPEINAITSTFVDKIKDFFEIKQLMIANVLTLFENKTTAVTELTITNNLNTTQLFTWKFDTGTQNVTSNNLTNIMSGNVFIYIASNYSISDIYRTNATINTSIYNDSMLGVVVIS